MSTSLGAPATETAAPDDDPPGILSRATGLMGAPSTASQPVIEHPSSSMRVADAAPAARSDATAGASRASACVATAGEPRLVTLPCTSKTSWIENLIPRSGPLAFPFSLSSSWKALRASDLFLHLAPSRLLAAPGEHQSAIDAALARINPSGPFQYRAVARSDLCWSHATSTVKCTTVDGKGKPK